MASKQKKNVCGIINLSFRLQTSECYSNRKFYNATWCDKVVKGKKPKSSYPGPNLFLFGVCDTGQISNAFPSLSFLGIIRYSDLLTKRLYFVSYSLGKHSGRSTCKYY